MRQRIKAIIQQHTSTQWMSTQEAIERIRESGMRMTPPTLIKLVNRGELVGKRVGARYFISTESIENLLGITK